MKVIVEMSFGVFPLPMGVTKLPKAALEALEEALKQTFGKMIAQKPLEMKDEPFLQAVISEFNEKTLAFINHIEKENAPRLIVPKHGPSGLVGDPQ